MIVTSLHQLSWFGVMTLATYSATVASLSALEPRDRICKNVDAFYKNVTGACSDYITAIEACPPQSATTEDILDQAMQLSYCINRRATAFFKCDAWDSETPGNIKLGILSSNNAFKEWLDGGRNRSSPADTGSQNSSCKYPEFFPAFKNALAYYLARVEYGCCAIEAKQAERSSQISTSYSVYTHTAYSYSYISRVVMITTYITRSGGFYSVKPTTTGQYTSWAVSTSTGTITSTTNLSPTAIVAAPEVQEDTVIAMGNLEDAVAIIPMQYLRCARQKKPDEVNDCVHDAANKLRFLPSSMFLYGGQQGCGNSGKLLFAFVVIAMLIEIASFIYDVYKARKARKAKQEADNQDIDPEDANAQRVQQLAPKQMGYQFQGQHMNLPHQSPYGIQAPIYPNQTNPIQPAPQAGSVPPSNPFLEDPNPDKSRQQFSFWNITAHVLKAFLPGLLVAMVLNRYSLLSTFLMLTGLTLLLPRIAPLIAIASPFAFGSKEHGVQILLADTVITILSGFFLQPALEALGYLGNPFRGPAYPHETTNAILPPELSVSPPPHEVHTVYLGIRIALATGQIFLLFWATSLLLSIVGAVFYALVCVPAKRSVKPVWPLIKYILVFYFFYLLVPLILFLGVLELLYRLKEMALKKKGQRRVFPPLRYFRAKLDQQHGSWYAKTVGKVFYPLWCCLQMGAFVGRWMAWSGLLKVAGDAYCPKKGPTAAGVYIGVTAGLVMIQSLLQRFLGI